jgi:hypothetical protein
MKELIDALIKIEGSRKAVAAKLRKSDNYIYRLQQSLRTPSDKLLKEIKALYPSQSTLIDVIQLNKLK